MIVTMKIASVQVTSVHKVGWTICRSFQFRQVSIFIENMVAICWGKGCLLYVGVHIKWVSLEWGFTVALDDPHIVINCSQVLCSGFLLFVLCQISIFLGKMCFKYFCKFLSQKEKGKMLPRMKTSLKTKRRSPA